MPWIGRIVDAHLTEASAAELLNLGVETSTDLASVWSAEIEILEAFVDPDIQSQITAARRAARVEADIALAHVPEQPIIKRPREIPVQCAAGARPKKACCSPGILIARALPSVLCAAGAVATTGPKR